MFLGAYQVDGDPARLVPAYDALRRGLPAEQFELHVCVVTTVGITVYDACPDREVFDGFSVGPEFGAAVAAAGLPAPRIEPLGEVHDAVVAKSVIR